MRLQIASDLHLEHRPNASKIVSAMKPRSDTVLILAGDITSMKYFDQAKQDMHDLCEGWEQVFWVLGNHEYYWCDVPEAWFSANAIASSLPNLKVMSSKRAVEYKGKRFIGDTMWFPFKPDNLLYERMLSDFGLIKDFVPWVYDQNNETVQDFQATMQEGDIVITHHLPSPKSIHPKFAASDLNRFFLSDISALIEEKKPALFVHGHTHEQFDYNIGATRIIANPLGYPNERVDTQFNPQLIVEI